MTRAPGWLREPLAQFVVIGAGLFVADAVVNRGARLNVGSRQIVITTDDLSQLRSTFVAQWQRLPSPEEMRGLEENKIRDEVLYREALTLGLDGDDVIIKRRLAQKMQFLAEDVAATHQPTSAELRAWFADTRDRFALPSTVSFRHLYFSPDRRGQRAHDDAVNLLARIAARGESDAGAGADPFMFKDYYADQTADELAKDFGAQFAAAIQKVTTRSWQGPVESGYGWHLVFVDSVVPGRTPGFEEVETAVRAAWLADQKQRASQTAYAGMRAKYSVSLPAAAEQSARMR